MKAMPNAGRVRSVFVVEEKLLPSAEELPVYASKTVSSQK